MRTRAIRALMPRDSVMTTCTRIYLSHSLDLALAGARILFNNISMAAKEEYEEVEEVRRLFFRGEV